ncbi:ankyrin repeat protein, partial [Jimgerdemannia flammicorona]
MAKLLLDKDADVNARRQNWTPLNLAAENGHVEVAKLLFDMGGDMNVVDDWNLTPLHLASVKGHVAMIKLLLDLGVDGKANN